MTDIEKKLKQELDEAKKTVEEQRQRIQYFESNGIMARGVYLAAALKFGTEVAPGVMEMVLPTQNIRRDGEYDINITELADQRAVVVRVRRA